MLKTLTRALYFFILFPAFCSLAEPISFDFGAEGGTVTARAIQIFVVVTILSLAPSILVMITSFTRIVIVFSMLRNAIGLQQSPPNMIMVSLALFLTGFIMTPVFEKAYNNGIKPLIEEKITEEKAFDNSMAPFVEFMKKNVREKDLELFMSISSKVPLTKEALLSPSISSLIPAFMISELRRAFIIGFLLFLPFLIIDIVVAAILMAMGMMMVPPAMISLPLKVIFFVAVDGWYLLCGSLVKSFIM
jgi:flagellar biosynthetic protein FliP